MQDDQIDGPITQKVGAVKQNQSEVKVVDAPTRPLIAARPPEQYTQRDSDVAAFPGKPPEKLFSTPVPVPAVEKQRKQKASPVKKHDTAVMHMFQERCHQLSLSLFLQQHTAIRSLGFTSAINGEGKSFLSAVMASALASDNDRPVTLLECNWERPGIHDYYHLPATPGVAEWLRHECREEDIRYRVHQNLTVIPAGNGRNDAIRLLQQMRQQGLLKLFAPKDELLLVDLPAIVTTAYGQIAANLLDAIILVVHAGVTPNTLVEEACSKLKEAPLQGIVLNQLHSKIPRWLRQIL